MVFSTNAGQKRQQGEHARIRAGLEGERRKSMRTPAQGADDMAELFYGFE